MAKIQEKNTGATLAKEKELSERDKKAEQGRADKNEYLKRKQKMLEFEAKNYDKIMFFRGTQGYFMAGGHSAVLLAYKIAPELKLRPRMKLDADYGKKFKEGVISVKQIDFYRQRLSESSYLEFVKQTQDALVFRFKQPITEEEYDLLENTESIARQKLLDMVAKTSPFPKLYVRLVSVAETTYRLHHKHPDKIAMDYITSDIAGMGRRALETYLEMARGECTELDGLKEISSLTSKMSIKMVLVSEMKLWTREECARAADEIVGAMGCAEGILRNRSRLRRAKTNNDDEPAQEAC